MVQARVVARALAALVVFSGCSAEPQRFPTLPTVLPSAPPVALRGEIFVASAVPEPGARLTVADCNPVGVQRLCTEALRLVFDVIVDRDVPDAFLAFAQSEGSRSLEGTWGVEVTPYNCATGVRFAPFWTLQSFAFGGTMTVVTTNQLLPAPPTPGLGKWGAAGGSSFSSAYVLFLLLGPAVQPWAQRITQTLTISGDQLTGEARGEPFVLPGPLPSPSTPLPPAGCASLSGRRYP